MSASCSDGRTPPRFLVSLQKMLAQEEPSILSWDAGRLVLNNPQRLVDEVLGKYFRHSRYTSFQRQLHYFGFHKIEGKGRFVRSVYVNPDLDGRPVESILAVQRKGPNATSKPEGDDLDDSTSDSDSGTASRGASPARVVPPPARSSRRLHIAAATGHQARAVKRRRSAMDVRDDPPVTKPQPSALPAKRGSVEFVKAEPSVLPAKRGGRFAKQDPPAIPAKRGNPFINKEAPAHPAKRGNLLPIHAAPYDSLLADLGISQRGRTFGDAPGSFPSPLSPLRWISRGGLGPVYGRVSTPKAMAVGMTNCGMEGVGGEGNVSFDIGAELDIMGLGVEREQPLFDDALWNVELMAVP